MLRIGLTMLAFVAMLAGAVAEEQSRTVVFEGAVRRGETFSRALGEHLAFALEPDRNGWGWRIWMGDPRRPLDDYVSVATPPYRFVRSIQLFGWHFRNADNTGPNAPGPNSVNAPQEVRDFRFVETPADYRAARQALEVALWGNGRSASEIAAARTLLLDGEGWGHGVLEITSLEFGNLVPNRRAWIERMAFTVTLTLSAE